MFLWFYQYIYSNNMIANKKKTTKCLKSKRGISKVQKYSINTEASKHPHASNNTEHFRIITLNIPLNYVVKFLKVFSFYSILKYFK
jgi:hypothetical protein